MKKILVFGAGSGIAAAYSSQELKKGAKLFLAARTPSKLDALVAEANGLGRASDVRVVRFNATSTDPDAFLKEALAFLGGIDIVLIAYGTYRDQRLCQRDPAAAQLEIEENFTSQVRWLTALAPIFEKQARGTIAVISSVSGDKGRQSNYVYGAAKAGLNAYLEGLRHRLWGSGVTVLTVKPGFVDTPMTANLPKGPLFASAPRVARDIGRAIDSGSSVLYTPWFWRWILLALRHTPNFLFYRTKI